MQQMNTSKKITSILFVNGDLNSRLTDDAVNMCHLVGVDPKDCLAKTTEFFEQHEKLNERDATKAQVQYEKNRQIKLDVVARNLIQFRNNQSPQRKSMATFTSLAMAPAERSLHTSGGAGASSHIFGSRNKSFSRLHSGWDPTATHHEMHAATQRKEMQLKERAEKNKLKWIQVMNKKEELTDEYHKNMKKQLEKRFTIERRQEKDFKFMQETRAFNTQERATKTAEKQKKIQERDFKLAKGLREVEAKSRERMRQTTSRRQQILNEMTRGNSARKNFNKSMSNAGGAMYSPDTRSPGLYQTSGMAQSASNFFAPGILDSEERNKRLQSFLDFREAQTTLMEKDEAIEMARKKRQQSNTMKLANVKADTMRVQHKLDERHADEDGNFEQVFRQVVEHRAANAKKKRANDIYKKECAEFAAKEREEKRVAIQNKFREQNQKAYVSSMQFMKKYNARDTAKTLSQNRELEVEQMRAHHENRMMVQSMNMQRRMRMQSAYRQQLVDDLMIKRQRAASIEKIRKESVSKQQSNARALQNHWQHVVQHGIRTLQPVTIETHKKEYDIERRRKARANLAEGKN